jgi:hypothetical protein
MKKKTYLILFVAIVVICVLVLKKKSAEPDTVDTTDTQEQETEVAEQVEDTTKEESSSVNTETESTEETETETETAYTGIEDMDIDAYYHTLGDVVAVYSVKDSERTQTEAEAEALFTERGFDQREITFDYSMDGEYLGDTEITGSDERHPMYQTYYISSSEEFWTVYLSNGYFLAYPVSYAMVSERKAPLVVSETEIFPGYNDIDNTFYEVIPYESQYILKQTHQINAETLDSLTVDVLAGL